MREIKFRAWDKKNKVMQYSDIIWGDYNFPALSELNYGDNIYNLSNLMQYTGLQDKNNKEIFEFDVIPIVIENLGESIKTVNGVVKIEQGQWNIEYLHPFQNEIYLANLYSLLERAEKEVIGNIYENPELLDRVEEVEEITVMEGTREALDKIVI